MVAGVTLVTVWRLSLTTFVLFTGHGGGWGYSGHSVEAVRFSCDTDILLGGFGLFGGRGEYVGRIKVILHLMSMKIK